MNLNKHLSREHADSYSAAAEYSTNKTKDGTDECFGRKIGKASDSKTIYYLCLIHILA